MNFLFDKDQLERLLPDYLTKAEKGRLMMALEQFHEEGSSKPAAWSGKFYSHFYLQNKPAFFLQGDLLREIRQPNFRPEMEQFDKIFAGAIILSNTCDMDLDNRRVIPKEVVLAPLTPFHRFIHRLRSQFQDEKRLANIINGVKSQTYSNVFYLPPIGETGEEFVTFFDNVFWFPTEELNSYLPDLDQTRIASLDYFGYYLFLVKLSYHFCRLPEEKQR